MNDQDTHDEEPVGGPDDELTAVFGEEIGEPEPPVQIRRRNRRFAPWHHPVKQIVRKRQWMYHTEILLRHLRTSEVLRYFTLPGPELLDIRALSDVCTPRGRKIEYFGFNSGARTWAANEEEAGGAEGLTSAESALRQAGRITDNAVVLPDRLEDIAVPGSHAASQLSQQDPFDVINIDACNHLAYSPEGREHFTTFDAVRALLGHQARRTEPWLLFITTRVDPQQLGLPLFQLQQAVSENISQSRDEFGRALGRVIGAELHLLGTAVSACWQRRDEYFLKLYSIGLGKFLLQHFRRQPQLSADVEMVSAFAYRITGEHPDMLALAFRITPHPLRVYPPAGGAPPVASPPEVELALRIVGKAAEMWDLDRAITEQEDVLREAVEGTEALLRSVNLDLEEWRMWLAQHSERPLMLESDDPTTAGG